ncbi:MAG TPA: AAA family ATPase [Actinomycetota bacterium]|nr:AAA family ATPase [Actinomycetota bacterium]
MFVKALRLSGFKSFANPTVLEFERGVNVIVGPNGSGKSNIADALTWVLGSQAPTTLRGASMEDVIFAGSAGRPRLGIAEVALTLDNASGVLPLDLSEVTISRSTDRSGASEYRINGAPCRLLDVAELLSDTGIGRSIHTVVGQGQLDAVLQARPEDRRSFIEEAGQIGKYRRRKDRALKKLERVEDNLTRLNDVLTELRRSIRPLKRQASVAAMHSELVAEHVGLRQRLAATELARLAGEEAGLDLTSEVRRAELLGEELEGVRARLESAASQRAELAEAADEARSIAHRIHRSSDRLRALGRLASERAETIAARLAAETEEGYRERIRLLQGERSRWGAETEALAAAAAEARERAVAAGAQAAEAAEAAAGEETILSAARSEETAATQALVRAEGSEAAGRATLGSIQARVKAVEERREVAQRELVSDSAKAGAALTEVRNLETELDRVTEAAAAAEMALEEAREKADLLKSSLGATQAGRAAAVARLEALREVDELFADAGELRGRLRPLLEAAEASAEIATASEDEAAAILASAEAEAESRWQEVARQDEELRRLDALLSAAADRLAGRRRRHEAREVELAALDEELSRARDALATAERAATEERAALPERKAAVEVARERREAAERRLAIAREKATALATEATEQEVAARGAEQRAGAARARVAEAETGIADAEAALEGLEDLRAALDRKRRRAEEVAYAATDAAARAAAWARDADARADRARERQRAGETQLEALRARERELGQGLEELARRRNAAEVRRAETRARAAAVAERALEEWGLTADDLTALGRLDPNAEAEARTRVNELDRQMKRLGTVNPRAAEEYEELAERESFLETQMSDLRSSKRDLMAVVSEVDETIVEVFSQAFTDVAAEFEGVIQRLFPGGSGQLKLTNPDDILTSGIEIEARPPGKNVRKLSLLSGGERSLVALAFLFSIFRSRPSPFYLLDEVEAALDDVNLQRFLGLVEELEERAQILIVTHQKRTMEAADVLYGVSMAKDGVSHVVAQRMEDVTVS